MTGYIRKDTTNNIADGNIINADDLDNEFDGVQAAFHASTGHTHDGSASEGAAITKVGPVQDVLITSTAMYPKTTNTVDLGTSSLKYKDAFIAGNETVGGTLAVTGVATLTAQPVLSSLTASQAVFTDASKGLVSNAITGTGNVVMSASPTLTGTIGGASATLSGTLAVTGVATLTAQPILSSLTASSAVATDASKGLVSVTNTGTGNNVLSTSPTLVTPALGTPTALVGTNITGTATNFTASNVTTNANLTGAVTSVGNATSLGSFTSAALAGALTDETGSGAAVFATSPTLVTPALGTPTALVGTNITGTAAGLTAGNVTTNANLTGAITSVGNASSLGSFTSADLSAALTDETGSGVAVFATSPTLVTPVIGAATGTSLILSAATTTDALRITQTGAGNAFVVEDSANPDASPFVIDAAGVVLAGFTTAPAGSYKAYVSGTAFATGAWRVGDSTDGSTSGYLSNTSNVSKSIQIAADPDNLGANSLITFNIDGSEKARFSSTGNLLIGTATGSAAGIRNTWNPTGGTTAYGILVNGTIQSDVTSAVNLLGTIANTAAATFNLTNLRHFAATANPFGAGSTVTNQFGFFAASDLSEATNNYGFYGSLAAATGRFNFYAAGTASNFFGGNTVISVTDNTNAALRVTQLGTGDALLIEDATNPDSTPFVVNNAGKVLIARTTASVIADAALQINVQSATIPAMLTNTGSTSYRPHWSLTVADTEVASFGTTNTVLNTYVGGASRMTISALGGTTLLPATGAGAGLIVTGTNLSGATTNAGIFSNITFGSAATTRGEGFQTTLGTEAATFTLGEMGHFKAVQGTFGLNSVVTNQYGFLADATLIGATNNYGFYSNIASTAGRFNFYANGTAINYFAGSVGIGTNAPSAELHAAASEATAYNGAATDGQLAAGATVFVQQTAGTNTGVAQIAFQSRAAQPYNRIVSSGGSAPFMTFITNNAERLRIDSAGKVGIATATPLVSLDITGTDAIKVPVGTTGERPTGSTGYFRFNSSNVQFEGYNGSAWAGVGGASGGGGNPIMYENDNVVSVSYTMTTGKNASSTGPLTINDGIAVTVPSGSTWVIL